MKGYNFSQNYNAKLLIKHGKNQIQRKEVWGLSQDAYKC